MSTCSQCHCSVRSGLTACPACGAQIPGPEGIEAADPEPDPSSSFETGARRRMRVGARNHPTSSHEPAARLRLVSRVEGSLALSARRNQDPDASRQVQLTPAASPARPAEVVALRPQPAAAAAPAPALPIARRAPTPPVLASEALRKELLPAAPASRACRFLLVLLGVCGTAAAFVVGSANGLGVPLGGALLTLGLLGVVPMTYQARAAATAAIGSSGLLVVHWTRLQLGSGPGPVLLVGGMSLLATGLLFRGWHRGSRLARALVACGIALCVAWLWTSAIPAQLLVLEGAWQAWLSPLLTTPLPLLLLLSLLAFMDARTTGGSTGWAALGLGWYTLLSWAALCQLAWPAGSGFQLARVPEAMAIALLVGPLFAVALSVGLAQLLASTRSALR